MNPRLWSCRTFAALWGVLLAPLAPALGDAREAAQRMPADALAYVGWSQLLDEEEGSLLDLLPAIANRFGADPDVVEILNQVAEAGRIALTNSGGVVLLEAGQGPEGKPAPGLLVVVKPGQDAERLSQAVKRLLEVAQDTPVRSTTIEQRAFHFAGESDEFALLWGEIDDALILVGSVDPAEFYRTKLADMREPLAADPAFKACRGKIGQGPNPSFCAFANVRGLVELIERLARTPNRESQPTLEEILREVGVSSVHAVYAEAAGSELGTRLQAFVKTDGSRKGILKLWDNRPLDDASLQLIPKNATAAAAYNLDLSALWDETRRVVEALDPNVALKVDGALAGVSAMLGFSPTEHLLPALGDTWVVFDAPDHGGFLITGLVLVVEVEDREALRGAFEGVIRVLTPLAAQAKMQPTHGVMERDGHTIHYLVLAGWPAPVAPAVCFIGDHAVFGLSPQAVAVAAKQVDPKTRSSSILDHPDVVAARKHLPPGLQSFFYSDQRAAARANYPLGHFVGTALASAAAPGQADPGLIPTLPESLAEVRCGVGGWAADEDGLLYTSYGNVVPLALPGEQMTTVAVIALLISILLPSLSRARELAKRAVSASNLRGIGMGLHIYANDHQDAFPESLDDLVDQGMITREMLNSPRDEEGAVSYVYISAQSESSGIRNVIAYERIIGDEGTNVLFIDGHVQWMKLDAFKRTLLETYQRLGRENEMPAGLMP